MMIVTVITTCSMNSKSLHFPIFSLRYTKIPKSFIHTFTFINCLF